MKNSSEPSPSQFDFVKISEWENEELKWKKKKKSTWGNENQLLMSGTV